jgi:Tol biopolymer transport system component
MVSVADGSVLFANPPGFFRAGRTLIGIDGHSTEQIDRPGEVYALSLAADKIHVVESRYEKTAPYFFIYTWELSKFAQWNERLITDGQFPSWSPDMKQIAFFRFSGAESSSLYIMNADGSNIRLLRNTFMVTAPASWSPDGTQLAFSTSDNDNSVTQDVYVMNIDSKSETPVVKSGSTAEFPAWSPDGKQLAYVSHDIYTINVDGSNRHNVTNSKLSYITSVGWSPDSQSLAFLAQAIGNPPKQSVYVVDSDGSGLHTIFNACP